MSFNNKFVLKKLKKKKEKNILIIKVNKNTYIIYKLHNYTNTNYTIKDYIYKFYIYINFIKLNKLIHIICIYFHTYIIDNQKKTKYSEKINKILKHKIKLM